MNHKIRNYGRVLRCFIATSLVIALFLIPLADLRSVARAQGQALTGQVPASATPDDLSAQGRAISSATASAERGGVRLQWRSNSARESLRLHIYRIRTGRRTFEAVGADSLSSLTSERSGAGYSYEWFDSQGTSDSIYYIDSSNLNGKGETEDALVSLSAGDQARKQRTAAAAETATYGRGSLLQSVVSATAPVVLAQSAQASINNQWLVASKVALKIQTKTDGWYRVTQQQMAAAGFSPTVDVRNLSLFGDGDEFAIKTSKASGQFSPGDYIEFYGQGLDTLDTDTRIYYLIAGTSAGKRVASEHQVGVDSIQTSGATQSIDGEFTYRDWFAPLLDFRTGESSLPKQLEETKAPTSQPAKNSFEVFTSPSVADAPVESVRPIKSTPSASADVAGVEPGTSLSVETIPAVAKIVKSAPKAAGRSKSRKGKSRRRSGGRVGKSKPRYNHAAPLAAAALSFDDTLEVKERFNFNTQLAAGFNFFGSTIGTAFPLTKTLTIHDLQANAGETARVEIALQGLSLQSHQVNILCNNVVIGTMTNFFGRAHKVQTFTFPVEQLIEGNNQIKIAPVPSGEFLGLDRITLTFPRGYHAFNNSLRFRARLAQTLKVDGFSTPNVQLLDISDPANVRVSTPVSEVSGTGFAITVPPAPRNKFRAPVFSVPERQPLRTLYALPQGQFETPAALTLNQPSTLNQGTSSTGGDLLIIAAKAFIPSLAPLIAQRQGQGLSVVVADVEDVYDEFSFGAHSTQALQDFLSWARDHWTTPPRYVLLAGDGSYDPRAHFAIVMRRAGAGCTDTGNNARDFSMMQFGDPHNNGFQNQTPCSGSSGLVISQIYPGGGEKQASYANSYIELRNGGSTPIDVKDWSVQYASATGNTWQVTKLSAVPKIIQPGGYFLVKQVGFGGTFALPTPDATGNISMSFTAGKVALVNNSTALTNACATGASVVDAVGYGSSAACFEGSGPVALSDDFVPTRQVDTLFGVACSDDALSDFNNDGIPEVPVGRLPARTPAEAALMVSKIVSFTKPVPQTALFVADAQGTYYWNFETHSDELALLVPGTITKQKIYLASQPSPAACQANIINTINQGPALVNYQGHGNVNVWSGSSIFTATDAQNLTNGNRLPLVIVADCLNGLFNDPVLEGLGETILKAPNGGGVAAYASSGETIPDGQQEMSIRVFQLLFGPTSMALGDVTKQAKGATSDLDVRRTWILLGDPSMKIW